MNIKQVSQETQISKDTLRYWEKVGLITDVSRNSSGYRDYTEQQLQQIEYVKCMRAARISIEALLEYTKLSQQGSETLAIRKQILIAQRKQIVAQLEHFQTMLELLDKKIEKITG